MWRKRIDELRLTASWALIAVMAFVYLLNSILAFVSPSCGFWGLPELFQPKIIAWFWSIPVVLGAAVWLKLHPFSLKAWHLGVFILGLQCTLTPDLHPHSLAIEGHFIFFCALVFISLALDVYLLWNFAAIVGIGHTIMGVYYPLCIYGTVSASWTRAMIHAGYISLEVVGLIWFIYQRRAHLRRLYLAEDKLEETIRTRTTELQTAVNTLQNTNTELQSLNELMLKREEKVLSLKKEVNNLSRELRRLPRYELPT